MCHTANKIAMIYRQDFVSLPLKVFAASICDSEKNK